MQERQKVIAADAIVEVLQSDSFVGDPVAAAFARTVARHIDAARATHMAFLTAMEFDIVVRMASDALRESWDSVADITREPLLAGKDDAFYDALAEANAEPLSRLFFTDQDTSVAHATGAALRSVTGIPQMGEYTYGGDEHGS